MNAHKISVAFVLTFFLLLSLEAFSQVAPVYLPAPEQTNSYLHSNSNSVREAVTLKMATDRQNQNEISFLLKETADQFKKSGSVGFIKDLDARLGLEKLKLTALKAELDLQKGDLRGSAPLRTSLVKLIGAGDLTGLIDDAKKMFSEQGGDLLMGTLNFEATQNQSTVLKVLLIEILLTLRGEKNLQSALDLQKNITLLYPAKLPAIEFATAMDEISFFTIASSGEKQLLIPNSGFIFGGDFVDGNLRGIDCSSFLCKSTNARARLSTMVMEFAWRTQMHDSFDRDDADGKLRNEFYKNWGLTEGLQDYLAVKPAAENLQPGDLVIWRWTGANGKSRDGHVVMFVEWADRAQGSFIAIEANREDDKSLEGIVFRKLELLAPKKELYILRRI